MLPLLSADLSISNADRHLSGREQVAGTRRPHVRTVRIVGVPRAYLMTSSVSDVVLEAGSEGRVRFPSIAEASILTLKRGVEGTVVGLPAELTLRSFGLRARSRSVVLRGDFGEVVGTLMSPSRHQVSWGDGNTIEIHRDYGWVTTVASMEPDDLCVPIFLAASGVLRALSLLANLTL